jgi:hypothetical protein
VMVVSSSAPVAWVINSLLFASVDDVAVLGGVVSSLVSVPSMRGVHLEVCSRLGVDCAEAGRGG